MIGIMGDALFFFRINSTAAAHRVKKANTSVKIMHMHRTLGGYFSRVSVPRASKLRYGRSVTGGLMKDCWKIPLRSSQSQPTPPGDYILKLQWTIRGTKIYKRAGIYLKKVGPRFRTLLSHLLNQRTTSLRII